MTNAVSVFGVRLYMRQDEDPAEIVDQFVGIIAKSDRDPERLRNVSYYVGHALGGAIAENIPEPTVPFRPGTLGAASQEAGLVLPPSEWLALARQRIMELVDDGVDPVFLVRGLCQYVTDWMRSMGDEMSAANERRADLRRDLYGIADDPQRLEDYMEARDDDEGGRTPAEVAETLRGMADKLDPLTIEDATDQWAMLEAWRSDVDTVLGGAP